MLTLAVFSGIVIFHELRQNASAFRGVFNKFGKKNSSIRMALRVDHVSHSCSTKVRLRVDGYYAGIEISGVALLYTSRPHFFLPLCR